MIRGKKSNNFKLRSYEYIDPECIFNILKGEVSACLYKKIITPDLCDSIKDNFWNNPGLSWRPDGVPAYYVGSYHYNKSPTNYLEETNLKKEFVDFLFRNMKNPVFELLKIVKLNLENKGIELRAAKLNELDANYCRALAWKGEGRFSLAPHDDIAQAHSAINKGFEINEISSIAAINFYINLPHTGGDLMLWNIQPTSKTKKQLNISETGYPYNYKDLHGIENQILYLDRGDIGVINGAMVHSVTQYESDKHQSRLILNLFLGMLNENTVIWWT